MKPSRDRPAAPVASNPVPEQAETAVHAVFDATSTAWADGDAETFVGWYADDATVILPGVQLDGKAAIRDAMATAFSGPLKDTRRIHLVRSVRLLADDTAIVVTKSTTTSSAEAADATQRWEMATWTLTKATGQWLVMAYHSCPAA